MSWASVSPTTRCRAVFSSRKITDTNIHSHNRTAMYEVPPVTHAKQNVAGAQRFAPIITPCRNRVHRQYVSYRALKLVWVSERKLGQ
jgi:hypothetical protein